MESEFLTILLLVLLPVGGNFLGGLVTEFYRVSESHVGIALHAAVGVLLAVIGVELMPRVIMADPPWLVVLFFVLGGAFFLLVDHYLHLMTNRLAILTGMKNPSAVAIYFGIAVDLFTDGLLIGTGFTISAGLGLYLALGQTTADIPEGFAGMASLKRYNMKRWMRLALGASFLIPALAGAVIGYYLLRGRPQIWQLSLLSFSAGILATVAVEEIVPEGHQEDESQFAALAFIGGFALFTFLSLYF